MKSIHEYIKKEDNRMSKRIKSTLAMAIIIGFTTAFVPCGNAQTNKSTTTGVTATTITKVQASKLLNSEYILKSGAAIKHNH